MERKMEAVMVNFALFYFMSICLHTLLANIIKIIGTL